MIPRSPIVVLLCLALVGVSAKTSADEVQSQAPHVILPVPDHFIPSTPSLRASYADYEQRFRVDDAKFRNVLEDLRGVVATRRIADRGKVIAQSGLLELTRRDAADDLFKLQQILAADSLRNPARQRENAEVIASFERDKQALSSTSLDVLGLLLKMN